MNAEENILVEVKNRYSKWKSKLHNKTVLKIPSANFVVIYLDNSKPKDNTTVRACSFFIHWFSVVKTQ